MPLHQADYQVKIYSPTDGLLRAILTPTQFGAFFLERTLNSFDTLTLSLAQANPVVQYFETDAIIEVWRKIPRPGSDWYIESTLLHRTPQRDFTERQRRIFTSYSRGLNDFLHRREIAYFASTAYTLKDGPGETVMKEFVDENAGPGADNADRKDAWVAPIFGLTIEPDNGQGDTWVESRPWKNLLDVLNEISISTGVDFNIERTGPRDFIFRTYYPQYGVDRSATVLFSPAYRNMTAITYVKSRTEEVNAVIILGQGERDQRRVLPVNDALAGNASPWNIIEAIRDARAQPTLTQMQTEATEALNEMKAQDSFIFKVLQTDTRQYGKDAEYWIGDIIRAEFEEISVVRKIVGVNISLGNGREEIDIKFAEYPTPESSA